MRSKLLRILLGLLGGLFFGSNAVAQGIIGGQIRDSLTHEPLAYASVFLANTTRGTNTDANGRFVLTDIPTGQYDFIVSYLGYKIYQQPVTINGSALVLNVLLAKATNQLGEVVVRPRANNPQDYEQFVKAFLGVTSFSRQCRVRNPEAVLVDYDAKKKLLTVNSTTYVEIENQALGYRIRYHGLRFQLDYQNQVVSFFGHPVFEDLATRSASKRQRWEANRQKAYLGSVTHFLKSVYNDQVTQEGFLVQKVRHVPNPKWPRADSLLRAYRATPSKHHTRADEDSLIRWQKEPPAFAMLYKRPLPTDSLRHAQLDSGRVWLRFHDLIQVTYQREKLDPAYIAVLLKISSNINVSRVARQPQVSTVHLLQHKAEIQANGQLNNPLAILNEGYWAFEKVGEMLPFDYRLPPTVQ